MPYVLKVVDVVGTITGLMRRGIEGSYISAYKPDAHNGRGEASGTRYPDRALKFPTIDAAMQFWRQQSAVRPFREDGEPNRPLTAVTIAVERLP